jgi:hypothetical protein
MPTRSSSSSKNSDNSSSNNNASNKAIPTVAFIFFTAVIVSIASVIVMNNSLIISFSSSSSSSSSSPPITTTGRKNIIIQNKVSAGGRLIVTTEDEEPDSVTFNNNNKNENENENNFKTNNNNNNNNIKNENENKNENKEVEKSISSATVAVADDAVTTTQSENKGRGATKNKINSNNNGKNTKSGRNGKATAIATEEQELDDDDADDGCNIKENQMGGTTTSTIKEEGSNLQLPLRPPYYILQIGEPRSGSTFQAQLLMAITDLKSKGTTTETSASTSSNSTNTNTVLFRNSPNPNMKKQQKANKNVKENEKHRTNQIYQGKDFFQQIIHNGFVQKSHDSVWIEKTLCELEKLKKQNHIAVFNSVVSDNTKNIDGLKKYNLNFDIGYNAHQQIMKSNEFRNCSLCEIDNYYKPIFDLSTHEITILKLYMSKYQLIRQCCGLQMSKYNRLRLHGCNVTEYQNNPVQHSYPWCEKHNMTDIEMEFDTLLKNNKMIYRSMDGEEDSKWTWMKLGDCKKFDEQIISGMDFNGARFDGNCTSLDSVDTTNKNFYTRSNNARKKRKGKKIAGGG